METAKEESKNMSEVSKTKSDRGNTELQVDSDRGSQENLVFRSTLDEIFVPPELLWSNIMSSPNRNRSLVRDTLAPAISETVLLNLMSWKYLIKILE
jgi:hypothetical protein